jgi:prephenate dehydrogenase
LRTVVESLVVAGNRGRRLLPLKPGREVTSAATIVVAVSDRAGELARLLADAASVGVNVEDVHVQHGAAASRGLVDLDIALADVPVLLAALQASGWLCWAPSQYNE